MSSLECSLQLVIDVFIFRVSYNVWSNIYFVCSFIVSFMFIYDSWVIITSGLRVCSLQFWKPVFLSSLSFVCVSPFLSPLSFHNNTAFPFLQKSESLALRLVCQPLTPIVGPMLWLHKMCCCPVVPRFHHNNIHFGSGPAWMECN